VADGPAARAIEFLDKSRRARGLKTGPGGNGSAVYASREGAWGLTDRRGSASAGAVPAGAGPLVPRRRLRLLQSARTAYTHGTCAVAAADAGSVSGA
jgi:hypothetical protein